MEHRRAPIVILPLAAIVLAVGVMAGTALFTSAPSAYADIDGPCSATIAGVDVAGLDPNAAGDAIDVDYDDDVVVSMSSSEPFRSHKIDLEFVRFWGSGGKVPVEDREDAGEMSFTETVNVSNFAWAGVGLYKVKGEATLQDGSRCEGAALIDIGGRSPFITIAGGVATLVGVVATLFTLVLVFGGAAGSPGSLSAIRQMVDAKEAGGSAEAQRDEAVQERASLNSAKGLLRAVIGWLTVVALALTTIPLLAISGGGSGDTRGEEETPAGSPGQPSRLPRAPWLPRISVLGLVNGLLAAGAGLVLLQQFSVTYVSVWLAYAGAIGGPLIYGVVLPTLAYTIAWLRVNRRVEQLER